MDKVIKTTPVTLVVTYRADKPRWYKKVPPGEGNFFLQQALWTLRQNGASILQQGDVMRDKAKMNDMSSPRPRRNDDGLGPTSDIGARLRALFGAVQDEPVPDRLLDLLEKLDEAEGKSSSAKGE
jgi:hypothetical protein